jgi:shikimate dehydrogenase
MVIGHPITHSLSPEMHNAGYKALGIDFVYVASDVVVEAIPDFIKGVRAMGIRGVSCTLPHKLEVMPYLDEIDPVAEKIGAVNTIVNEGGKLIGYNTDWLGVVAPLEKLVSLKGKKVAVLGAGGAARAAVYGLVNRGADVTIYNRTAQKAEALAREFGCYAASLPGEEIKTTDIIFNATSLGLHPDEDKTPLSDTLITSRHLVFDAVYNPYETRLLREAKARGAQVIHGAEMFVYQGVAQFKLYTGHEAPVDEMRQVVLRHLHPKGQRS